MVVTGVFKVLLALALAAFAAVITYALLHIVFNQFWSGLVAAFVGLLVFFGMFRV